MHTQGELVGAVYVPRGQHVPMPQLLLYLFVIGPVLVQAQQMDLAPVNHAFNGVVVFKTDKHEQLVMDFIDERGRYRQDIVLPEHLDAISIHFSPEENAIVLPCRTEQVHCISKEIFKLDVIRSTSRSTLPVPVDDPEGTQAIALFRNLINEAASHVASTLDETATPSGRMKSR